MIKNARNKRWDARGFTLIEAIATLVLITIIAAMAGLGIVEITKQYLFAQKAGETAQVSQVAMARMVKELTLIRSGTSNGATSITFSTPTAAGRTIGWTGGNTGSFVKPILMNSQPLIENVQNLTLQYFNSYDDTVLNRPYSQTSTVMIGISFTVTGADGITSTFTGRAFVRN